MRNEEQLWIFVGYGYIEPTIVTFKENGTYEYRHTGFFQKKVPVRKIPQECFGMEKDLLKYGEPTGMKAALVRYDIYGREKVPLATRESAWCGTSAKLIGELQSLRTKVFELEQENYSLRLELFDSKGDGLFEKRMIKAFKSTLDARNAGINESERFGQFSPWRPTAYPRVINP